MKEIILFGLSIIGAYFCYGIFAENIGFILRNKKKWGIPVRVQMKLLFKKRAKK